MEKELSPQESLQLIQSMIDKAKNNAVNNAFYFLLWGWLVFFCCIAAYVLTTVFHYQHAYYVWFLIFIGVFVSLYKGSKESRKEKHKTYVGEAIGSLWFGLGIAFMVLGFLNAFADTWKTAFTYYILLYAIGTFVSGFLLKFKPLIIGGIINFILVPVSLQFAYNEQQLICALALLVSYIIPGHLLQSQHKK